MGLAADAQLGVSATNINKERMPTAESWHWQGSLSVQNRSHGPANQKDEPIAVFTVALTFRVAAETVYLSGDAPQG